MRKKLNRVISVILAVILFASFELGMLNEVALYDASEVENSGKNINSKENSTESYVEKIEEQSSELEENSHNIIGRNEQKEVKLYSENRDFYFQDNRRIEREFVLDIENEEYDAITVSYRNTDGIKIGEEDITTKTQENKVKISFEPKNSKLNDKYKNVRDIQAENISIDVQMWKNDVIEETLTQEVWMLSTPYGNFVSDVDQIFNKRNYNNYLLENGIIDEATYEDLDREFHCYSDSSIESVNDVNVESGVVALSTSTSTSSYSDYVEIKYGIVSSSDASTLRVYGYVYWYDNNGVRHPAQCIKIEIMDDDVAFDDTIATVVTSTTGYFSKSFANQTDAVEGGRDIYLKVYPGDDSTMVYDCGNLAAFITPTTPPAIVVDFEYEPYYFTTSVSSNVMKTISGCYSYASEGSVVAKTFSIGNALYYGKEYEEYINGGTCINNISATAHYPFTWSEVSMSLPALNLGTMFVATNDYSNWGTILHEYGHTVEDKMNIFVGYDEILTYGLTYHEIKLNLTDYYKGNKKKALEISWNEGWASYYSLCAQKYYDLEKAGYPGVQLDCIFGEDIVHQQWYGEDNEMAVAAVLYTTVLEGLFTEQEMWNIVKDNKPQSFADLVALLIVELMADATSTDTFSSTEINCFYKILEEQNMSADTLKYEYKGAVFAPTFTWKEPEISSKNENGFDFQFQYNLVIVSYNPTYGYVSPTITGTSYTPSAEEWAAILDACPNGFYWTIRTTESHEPSSDGYFSQLVEMKSPRQLTVAANSKYEEDVLNVEAYQMYDYRVTFATEGNRVIQTFGEQDTVLELYSSDGALLLGRYDTDDRGYNRNALISYSFDANTEYIVRISLYNKANYGMVKLAIIPTYHHDSYEDAYGTYGLTTVSWSLGNDKVALFRYQFSSAGDVTFTMSSDTNTDTFLYIIDPVSTAILTRYNGSNCGTANLYDDDSGDGLQAQLTKTVVASKEYLVIIAFYNPHTMSGDFSINTSK